MVLWLWLWCQIPTHPAIKSQNILLHNLDTIIQLWTKILVQRSKMGAGLILFREHRTSFVIQYLAVICNLLTGF